MIKILLKFKKTIMLMVYFAISWIPYGIFQYFFIFNAFTFVCLPLLYLFFVNKYFKDVRFKHILFILYIITIPLIIYWSSFFPASQTNTIDGLNKINLYFYIIPHLLWILTLFLYEFENL